jgi:hypothetical protein
LRDKLVSLFIARVVDALDEQKASTAQTLFYLANGIEVPLEHLNDGRVRMVPGFDPVEAMKGIFQVKSCPGHRRKWPANASVAVWYRDHWFYIDDRDLDSKATLYLMLQLRRLDFARQTIPTPPALTLPLGR